ncbi:hypothetical protein EDD21DRAFT_432245 [Dissophora ornata]|nr:hypothetical protein BGZ58_004185 [Dissophora ornata]KAI8599794.1 hypothetical protein EDD21DRAFT_432245 [Dissophora ornata]
MTIGRLNFQEFGLQGHFGDGRTGRVFQAKWRGESVALKALEDLQGACIPRIKITGYARGIFAIAMEIAGSLLEVDMLSYRERLEIVNRLSLIHKHGIIYNDIRLGNLLVRRDDNRFQVRFIDFAWLRRTGNKPELKNELFKLKN